MVKLEVVEDEAFLNQPETSKNGALFQEDDDDDFTDTDSEISEPPSPSDLDETLYERISALRDIVPPKTRATISNITANTASAVSTGVTYGGKGLWVIISSVLLLGIPFALALSEEQALMEAERQQTMMQDGAQGLMAAGGEAEGSGQVKPAL